MYTTYFGLAEKPFSITPDPRFLYLSEQHAEALAHLQYGILEGGGFIQLTGEVGTGKTTLTRSLLARLPEEIDLALLLNPRVSVRELLVTICEELGLTDCADAADNKTLIDRLNARLLEAHARGHRAVLVIDEAQNLEVDVLEQLRLLTNLETDSAKLLQIILIGQPELRDTLARGDLRQLAQRITGRYHLGPLGLDDTLAYVRHRLAVAGVTREIFTQRALIEVHRVSAGTPRLINVICDRALLGAYTSEQATVSPKLVRDAAREICGHKPSSAPRLRTAIAGIAAAAIALVTIALWLRDANDAAEPPADLQSATVEAVVPAATAAAGTQTSQQQVSPPVTQPPSAGTAASSPASASLEEWLRGESGATGTDAAFSTLLGLWRVAPPADSAQPCRYAGEHGLHCEHQLGSWALLRSLNRPAILDLVDSRGDAHQVVLAALDDERATLQIGTQARAFAPAEIDRCWFGEFLILWRPDARAADLMLPGSRSEGVRWLREKLATLQGGNDASRDPALYDDVLVERVRAFQRQQGLLADGKAGLRTLIALDTALGGADTPLLRNGG